MLWEEVAVAVENDGDAGVAGAHGDLFRVGAGSDPQRDGGVAQIVHAQWCEPGLLDGRGPIAASKEPRGARRNPPLTGTRVRLGQVVGWRAGRARRRRMSAARRCERQPSSSAVRS